jgi:aminoglycoside/choline kinase family phosphotransferase
MIGPTAYDVASLAQDARVTVPADLERALVDHYVELRRQAGGFDAKSFAEAYAILAAQRAMRILGVFVRLAENAGKPGYLNHIPRVREYLARSLREPVLSGLSVWYEKHRLS